MSRFSCPRDPYGKISVDILNFWLFFTEGTWTRSYNFDNRSLLIKTKSNSTHWLLIPLIDEQLAPTKPFKNLQNIIELF